MSELSILPQITTVQYPADSKSPEIPFDFQKETDVFRALCDDFNDEVNAVRIRRELRANRKNVDQLRREGKLLPDETIIPDRTIEQNCQNEIAPYIAFTETPEEILSFSDPANPGFDYYQHSRWITSLLRDENWQQPWQKMEDCMILHGAGFFEVLFDDSAPSKSTFEYVRREHLIIPRDTRDLQGCHRLARKYEITKHQLKLLAAAFNFDPSIVAKIEDHYKTKNTFIPIFKYFLRDENNYVYNAWLAEHELGVQNWLRQPQAHFLGDLLPSQQGPPLPKPTTIIPFVEFPYRTQEDEAILLVQGQAALTVHVQEAMQGVLTAIVNTSIRASGLYASVDPGPGETPQNKELFALKSGYVHHGKMNFTALPWPNPVALSIAQYLGVKNASQMGQTDFAANTRNDTAKRATEIVAAKEEADKLKTARLALFSTRCLSAYKIRFKIILSQLQIGGIDPPPNLDVTPLFSPTISLAMAADVQVVKREQRKQKLVDFWPIIAPTPLAPVYFEAMLQTVFPDEWPIWKQAMQANQQAQQNNPLPAMAAAMADSIGDLPPDKQENFRQILNAVGPMIQPQQNEQQPATSNVAR